MTKLKVKFQRIYKHRTAENKYEDALYIKQEVLEEHIDKNKEEKRIPYIIAYNQYYQLWKFFMSYDHIQKSMVFLDKPRYAIRKGQQWFKVTDIKKTK